MSFPKYPEYKDSGVEWLGEVPAHWEIPRLKHLVRIRNGRDYKEVEVESGGYPVIGSGGEFSQASRYLYKGESVLLGRKGTIDRPLYINGSFWTVDTMFYTVLSQKVNGRYLFYYATCFRFDQYSTNTALPSMAQEDLANIQLAVPEPQEQAAIAAFLDHETARIDALVEEQKRLIELLKEKRQAVISHAVTKGLHPDVPMKDSGVEWLGEVPAHWDVLRLKNVSPEITVGIVVEPSKYYVDDGVPALRSLNVRPGKISTDQMVYISPEANEVLSKSKLRSGDLVSVRSGQPGTTAVVPSELDGCNCIDLIIIRKPELACEKFLCWFFASDCAIRQFSEGSGGAIQQHFNISTAANIIVPAPSRPEQDRIAEYIDSEISKIDELIATAKSASELLSEHCSALISAAVTGKIDVRGWQADQQSEQPEVLMAAEARATYG